ncbi:uncharacterized protein A1O9_07249 [Exophiala aquamarina CBS 119918]|uniref:NmrA-like domain-containing protein n=1 Tax=Exophiala aquamarina CBS 119918 TaxID=1182545 RepID=A0A072PAB4_9EURO|nr:uncharacterized protein A1O9_07249 [Exophiala aquamarina CBS 119918]KEF57059.1 hypothetical protein A1O9_07249 [Exophiala aquamarina CBS 119918]
MSSSFANEKPAGYKNHVENIAVVGAAGRSGGVITDALVQGGKHRVTGITRPGSTSEMPAGLHSVKKVDYDSHSSLVEALRGQDVLIITLPVMAPRETHTKLIDAAVEAGVSWIMPNEWGVDVSKVEMGTDVLVRSGIVAIREYIEKTGGGKTAWMGLCTGFWYEFSLAGTEARYGFDFDKKELTLYDEGTTKINTSTWPQVGRAVASLLSLKILPESKDDASPSLSQFKNKPVYVSSFFVSQRDMFESVLRVMGDSEKDWKVTYEDVAARFKRGQEIFKQGQTVGFGILLYARLFYKDGAGDINALLANKALGLPEEDFDRATKVGVEMAIAGNTNAIH